MECPFQNSLKLMKLPNCDSRVVIEDFANVGIKFFKKYLSLSYGVSSHDTLQGVLGWIDPREFNSSIME